MIVQLIDQVGDVLFAIPECQENSETQWFGDRLENSRQFLNPLEFNVHDNTSSL